MKLISDQNSLLECTSSSWFRIRRISQRASYDSYTSIIYCIHGRFNQIFKNRYRQWIVDIGQWCHKIDSCNNSWNDHDTTEFLYISNSTRTRFYCKNLAELQNNECQAKMTCVFLLLRIRWICCFLTTKEIVLTTS